jgi:hypothetical protein
MEYDAALAQHEAAVIGVRHGVTAEAVLNYAGCALKLGLAGNLQQAMSQAHAVLLARDMAAQSFLAFQDADGQLDQYLLDHGLFYPNAPSA